MGIYIVEILSLPHLRAKISVLGLRLALGRWPLQETINVIKVYVLLTNENSIN